MVSCEGLGKGGVQSVIMDIVRNLSDKYCFDVLLFTDEIRYYDNEFLKYGNIYRVPNKSTRIDYYTRFFRILTGTYKILKNGNYTVIHCHNSFESGICLLAARLAGVKIRIAHFHTIADNRVNFVRKIIDSFYCFLITQFATKKIACSEMALTSFVKEDSNCKIIMNPIDLDKFNSEKYTDSRPKDGKIHFIHVGRFDDNKNQLFVIDTFCYIKKVITYADLTLIGFGDEYKKRMKQRIKENDIGDSVRLLPHNSDIPKLLADSDYMIFPSISEGLGIALLEAQAMGVKCFVSDAVPKEADAGLCEFYDLNDGSRLWAEKIINSIQSVPRTKTCPDMHRFGLKNICGRYNEIYGLGE